MKGALGMLLLLPLAAGAQVFRWTDAQGKIHYGDRPPPEVKAQETKISSIPREAPSSEVEVLPTQIDHYLVQGQSIHELGQSMRRTSPKDEQGQPVWGNAQWNINWKFAHDMTNGCRIGKFTVTVASKIRMPEWLDRPQATADLRGKWSTFYRALMVHEEGHRDNGVRAGNDLARRIRGLGSHPDCAALNAQISNLGTRVIGEYSLVDQSYDRTTQHGVTQGAVLR